VGYLPIPFVERQIHPRLVIKSINNQARVAVSGVSSERPVKTGTFRDASREMQQMLYGIFKVF
jgi:hypothetical protein